MSGTSAQPATTVKIAGSVGALDRDQWDALAGADNPFVSYDFLTALEESGSVGPGTGWQPAPLIVEDDNRNLLAALPAYLKGHSRGEFVFDQAWADAYERAGGQYYPKLQIAVPFTPVSGPRILVAPTPNAAQYAGALLKAAETLCRNNGFSSAHAGFVEEGQIDWFEKAGWMMRTDTQFHWHNRDYQDFEGFLSDLASRKRKALRKERSAAQDGVDIIHLSGRDITPEYWDAFWEFYQDTGARKWGQPYLTREAFTLLGERMGERVLLMLAMEDGSPIAGALNFIGESALYGRYWGCSREKKFLHFELCYYQAIELAIARGLKRVEAGAQGGHKLARGYAPVTTWSAHWIADPAFRKAIGDYLARESEGIRSDQLYLQERTPFKKGA